MLFIKTKRRFFCCLSFFFSLNTYCFTGCSLSHNQWPQSGQVWNYNSLPFLRKQVCWTICNHCLCSFSLSRMLLMPQVLHSHFTTIFFFATPCFLQVCPIRFEKLMDAHTSMLPHLQSCFFYITYVQTFHPFLVFLNSLLFTIQLF